MRVLQWAVETLHLKAAAEYEAPYRYDRPPGLHCIMQPQEGEPLILEGYWDGGRDWTVRFALPTAGQWSWQIESADAGLNGLSGEISCEPINEEAISKNANLHGHIRVAPSGRYFEHADGTPFFLMADTNWAMPSLRCAPGKQHDGPFYIWLNDRLEKGFTAVLTTLFDIDQPNSGGHPFPNNTHWPGDGSYMPLNPAYFQALDTKMQALWEAGLVVACHPTWIGKQYGFEPEDAAWIWRYLLARYGAYNLIFSVSGEYHLGYEGSAAWRPWSKEEFNTMGEIIAEGNAYGHPLSIHPRGPLYDRDGEITNIHTASSGLDFHNAGWLDHNWIQGGQHPAVLVYTPTFLWMDYRREPSRPTWVAEGFYENNSPTGASARMVRWQAWTSFLSGGCGFGYGSGGVWQFYDPQDHASHRSGRSNQPSWDGLTWKEALNRSGSDQLLFLKEFMQHIPWWELAPAQDRLVIRGGDAEMEDESTPRCAATPNNIVAIYIPYGNSGKHIGVKGLPHRFRAGWFDPRNGETTFFESPQCRADGYGYWESPKVPNKSDWIICIMPEINA